jgi:hypothetical protein
VARKLEFDILSGGKISIDLDGCSTCSTRACIKKCRSSKTKPVLVIKDGAPVLNFDHEDIKKGACTECLACELDCRVYGNGAVNITLPIK